MCEEWTYGKCVNELCPLRHMQINVCNHLSPYHFCLKQVIKFRMTPSLSMTTKSRASEKFLALTAFCEVFLVYGLHPDQISNVYICACKWYSSVYYNHGQALIMIYDLFLFTLKVQRNNIQCYWEKQPSGCQKPHCMFKHLKPRLSTGAMDGKVISVQGNGSPLRNIPALIVCQKHVKRFICLGKTSKERGLVVLGFLFLKQTEV